MKKAKHFLWLTVVAITIIGILIGVLAHKTRRKAVPLDTSVSPDSSYQLTLFSVGEPGWPFGSAHGRITLTKAARTLSETEIDLAQDGCQISKENWSVAWQSDRAEVTLHADEQADEHWKIYFDGRAERSEHTAAADPAGLAAAAEPPAFLEESRALGALCREIYLQSEKTPSPDRGAADALTQSWKDKIEDVLIEAGYPVLNSDGVYPEYLENAGDVCAFWDSVEHGDDAETAFWSVAPDGGLFRTALSSLNGKQTIFKALEPLIFPSWMNIHFPEWK